MVRGDEVRDKLKTNKSSGPDGMHARALEELKCEIADLPVKICNMSPRLASVPENWKMSSAMRVVFFKGMEGEPGN